MKLRHAVAVALAGWCLTVGKQQGEFGSFGRLPQSYATKAECEKAKRDYVHKFHTDPHNRDVELQFVRCHEEEPAQIKTPSP